VHTLLGRENCITLRLSELLSSVSVEAVVGDLEKEIGAVEADSRSVGADTLFVAYRGVNVDGNDFIPAAITKGAVAVVGEVPAAQIAVGCSGATYVQVRDGREALAWISAAWYGYPSREMAVIGVTGTDGKTTTANLIYHVFRAAGRKAGMISTVDAIIDGQSVETGLHTTTPDSPSIQRLLRQMRDSGTDVCVLETTSHGLAHHRVTGCEYDVAVVTNVTHEHLDLHGSLEAYREAKSQLFRGLTQSFRKQGIPKISVLNRDDSSYEYLSRYAVDAQITYGVHASAHVMAQDISQTNQLLSFDMSSPWGRIRLESTLVGTFNVANILAAVATAMSLGVDAAAAARGVRAMSGVPGRMERVDVGQPFAALVDFAHTPQSLRAALQAARQLTDGRVIVVFGCAGLRDVAKRPLMGAIAAELADYAILTAEDPRTEDLGDILEEIAAGCRSAGGIEDSTFERVPDRGMALARAVALAREGDVVISCGKGHEQSMCFGEIEYPWDDRAGLLSALTGSPLQTLPTAGYDHEVNRA
jgi:UDP-N-acetylmuramoyl-L-alanyl-D-glutamate--2,6-diaminopimelate ligase